MKDLDKFIKENKTSKLRYWWYGLVVSIKARFKR